MRDTISKLNLTSGFSLSSLMAITFVISSGPCSATAMDARIEKQAQAQIDQTFEQKFSKISANISESSATNLARIRESLRKYRVLTKAQILEAKTISNNLADSIVAEHSTRFSLATAIVKSGYLMGVEELIRNSTKPLEYKTMSFTKLCTDGYIGEQDVAYLALQVPNAKGNDSYGDVRFIFSKEKVLPLGYFSTFAYTQGSARSPEPDYYCENPQKIFEMISPLYRSFLFKGLEDFKKLMYDSAIEYVWERGQNLNRFAATAAKFGQSSIDLANSHSRVNPGRSFEESIKINTMAMPNNDLVLVPAITALNQSIDLSIVWDVKAPMALDSYYNHLRTLPVSAQVLESYKGFPESINNTPTVFTDAYPFWELKIPRKLSLSYLDEVRFSETQQNSDEARALISELKAYASRENLRYEILNVEGNFVFRIQR